MLTNPLTFKITTNGNSICVVYTHSGDSYNLTFAVEELSQQSNPIDYIAIKGAQHFETVINRTQLSPHTDNELFKQGLSGQYSYSPIQLATLKDQERVIKTADMIGLIMEVLDDCGLLNERPQGADTWPRPS